MEFSDPIAFWLFLPLLFAALWHFRRVYRLTPALRYSDISLFGGSDSGAMSRLRFIPPLLLFAGLVFAVIALARPRVVEESSEIEAEGIDIVIALDLSTSMRAGDFQPKDRETVAKETLKEFIKRRPNDRIGLVVFAGVAYTQAPLTLDHRVLIEVVKTLKTGVIEDGTAIGNGLGVALNRLRESEAKSKVVVLITDGDNNAGNISPLEAAKLAAKMAVKIYTVQVGKGGRVPYPVGRDAFGRMVYQEVEIPVNPELLKRIAMETGGEMFIAEDTKGLERSFNEILDRLEKSKIAEAPSIRRYKELYNYALIPGALLIFLSQLLLLTRFRRLP
ncbi:MAG: VWA domain-containing protein [Myxococcota bacterium]